MFYMREGSLYTKFYHKIKKGDSVTETGRTKPIYEDGDDIYAIISDCNHKEIAQYKGVTHNNVCTITHRGVPKAKDGDILYTDDGRKFYIRGVENPGNLGVWTIYNAEERRDISAGEHTI